MGRAKKKVPDTIPVILVTPEQADHWLKTRFDNERSIRRGRVDAMVRDMLNDNWHFNGDVIRFDVKTGKLADGGHRLTSIVESETSQYFPVLDITEDARMVVDTGLARSLPDFLRYEGFTNVNVLAAIARRLAAYRSGQKGSSGGRFQPSHSEIRQFITENNDELEAAVRVGNEMHAARVPMPTSPPASVYFLAARKDEQLAKEFFEKLVSGLNLEEGDPVAALRQRAQKELVYRSGRRMHPDDAFRFTILAWNHTREGNIISRLQQPKGGWTKDNVPQVA